MKKKILASFIFLLLGFTTFAQKLASSNTLNNAFEEASKKGKPVLIIISVTNMPLPTNTQTAKVNFSSALDDKEVIEKINENFIVYKTLITDTSIRKILSKSSVQSFPAYIFLHPNQDIFYKDFGNFTDKRSYFSIIEKALNAAKEKSVTDLEKDYLADKDDNILLKKLIDTRKKVGIKDNADLIEAYVNNLKISDFNDYQTILYILEAGPYADGKAYKLAYTNRVITDSIYKTEPLQKRITINNTIISNTMWAAARSKNLSRAYAGANFARSTWSKDYRAAEKANNNQMLWYYSTIKDTTMYLKTASFFYDNYYMNLSADSIKHIEKKDRENFEKRNFPNTVSNAHMLSKKQLDSLVKIKGTSKVTQSMITVGSTSGNYANELNNAAWKFYETGTKNINYLSKAMIWSRRSIELNPLSGYYDTLAHILYRLDYFEEAVKNQELAIEKAKQEKRNTSHLEDELKKMRSKKI